MISIDIILSLMKGMVIMAEISEFSLNLSKNKIVSVYEEYTDDTSILLNSYNEKINDAIQNLKTYWETEGGKEEIQLLEELYTDFKDKLDTAMGKVGALDVQNGIVIIPKFNPTGLKNSNGGLVA